MEIEAATESKNKTLNNSVAITIVILSVFMAIMGIKSGNNAQAIEQTKSDVLNKWNQYQAARLKHDLSEHTLDTTRLLATIPGVPKEAVDAEVKKNSAAIEKYLEREKRYSTEARELQAKLDEANKRDDQFDVAEAILSIAIAISAVAILAEAWWLLAVGWVAGGSGMFLGVSAILRWSIYPEWLVNLLT